jgi:hypothetical protein
MRINGFEQIKSFYSWVFSNPDKVRPAHITLYLFLWNQGNRANWVEWFKCPYDLAMQGSCIGSKSTYYKALNELQEFGLIDYRKGVNDTKAPLIHLKQLYDNVPQTVPQSEPQSEPQTVPQSEPLTVPQSGKIYKLITSNYKLLNDNQDEFIEWIKEFIHRKKNTKKLSNLQILERYNRYLDVYSKVTGEKTKHRTKYKHVDKNFLYWLDIYQPNEIEQAIKNHDDTFWMKNLDPNKILRQRDQKGDAVDYIGQLLNHKPKPKFV